jgi:hypothetical protein
VTTEEYFTADDLSVRWSVSRSMIVGLKDLPRTDDGRFTVSSVLRYEQDRIVRPNPKNRMGVYFLRCGPFIKIGISDNVHRRLKGMRTDNPFDIEPVGFICCQTYPDAQRLESELHCQFDSERHHREWFRDCDRLRAVIQQRASAWPE